MPDVTLPGRLRGAVGRSDEPEFADWAEALPDAITTMAGRWRLQLGSPFEPGGQCAWVAPARSATGEDLVLKLGWRHDEALHEADALQLWHGAGAVWLREVDTFDHTTAMLLERCMPGTPLRRLDEPAQDRVIARLLRQLWVAPPERHPFRPLAAMCQRWADQFERRLSRASTGLDLGIARAALTVLRELPGSAAEHVVLCTDLHAENVLAATRDPWLVIDPKPYVGDPSYDPVQHLLNCERRLAADAAGLARHLADLLDLPPERVRLWLFARCAQEALDRPELGDIAARLAP